MNDGLAVVTGASGFVGSHLVEALAALGVRTRALVRATSETRWLPPGIDRCTASLDDAQALADVVRGASVVFHLAAVTSSARQPDYVRANVDGTRRVLDAVREHAATARVVLCSSLAALGPARDGRPLREDDAPQPVSPYGQSKLAAEGVADEFAAVHGLDLIILRPTAVYGPRDRDVLAAFRLARHGLALRVAPPDQRLTMIHARDLAAALVLAARRAPPPAGAVPRYHVSDGVTYSWRAVIEAIGAAVGRVPRVIPVPGSIAATVAAATTAVALVRHRKPLLTVHRISELAARDWSCDITRARRELGFEPAVRLEDGMRETAEWYRAQGWL